MMQKLVAFLPKMTAAFTGWFQTIAFLAQAVDVTVLPEPYRSRMIAFVGFIQAVQAVMAHHYAPNGQALTAGSPPYVPPPDPAPKPGPPTEWKPPLATGPAIQPGTPPDVLLPPLSGEGLGTLPRERKE